jgi:hypothetical protein
MLEYGDAFLEMNQEALIRLEKQLTPAGFAVAIEMAPEQDDVGIEDDELVAA